ncbi:unnamed protein product [Paramecium octaurelia]|uniref:Uncharacterized protein n=1 Tax=Paramecium octaurelia TaxID=43137 RepID=A0A8S1SLV6_PAROT|nr:unnamed protein product [Paramecium octaurelia]
MLDYVFKNHTNTIYDAQQVQQIIDQMMEISNTNQLVNPQIVYFINDILITSWLSIVDKKPPVNICFLFSQDGIKSFLTKPSNQWKFIPKYENQNEPDLTYLYNKNSKLIDIVHKLQVEFRLNYPYVQNTVAKDPSKIELEKKIIKYTDKMEKDWKGVKDLGDELLKEYISVQDQRVKLKQLKNYIAELNDKLADEIQCMSQFQADYSQEEVNEDNILKILVLDQAEDQICNLQASIYGIRDTYKYTQNRMKTSSNVTLEWVCSIVKQLAEQEFNDIQLLKKCNRCLYNQ